MTESEKGFQFYRDEFNAEIGRLDAEDEVGNSVAAILAEVAAQEAVKNAWKDERTAFLQQITNLHTEVQRQKEEAVKQSAEAQRQSEKYDRRVKMHLEHHDARMKRYETLIQTLTKALENVRQNKAPPPPLPKTPTPTALADTPTASPLPKSPAPVPVTIPVNVPVVPPVSPDSNLQANQEPEVTKEAPKEERPTSSSGGFMPEDQPKV